MATLAPFLHLTDGVTDLSLTDGVNYSLMRGWSPQIAGLRLDALGGSSEYEDVREAPPLIVRGTTAAICYRNLQALYSLLDQAERWWRGEKVNPVLLRYAPQGSIAGPLSALVIGSDAGQQRQQQLVALPTTYDQAGMVYEIDGVQPSILRRGQWLLPSYAVDNMISNSDFWNGTTGWTVYPSGTVGVVPFASAYGGKPGDEGGLAFGQAAVPVGQTLVDLYQSSLPLTSGVTYTVSFAGEATNVTGGATIQVYLSSAVGTTISNIAPVTLLGASGIHAGRHAATLTATASAANGRLNFQMNGQAVGSLLSIAEVIMAADPSATDWHRTTAEDTVSSVSSSVANGQVMSGAWPAALGAHSPVALSVTQAAGTEPLYGFYLIAADARKLQVLEAEQLYIGGASGWNVQADASNHASGGSVLRVTPAGVTTVSQQSTAFFATNPPASTRLGFFATVRNNSSATWQLQVVLSGINVYTPVTYIDGSLSTPQALYLGEVASQTIDTSTAMALVASVIGSPSGASLDIDCVWMLALDDPASAVVSMRNPGAAVYARLTIDPAALTSVQPLVQLVTASGVVYPSYAGDPYLLSNGGTIAVAIIAPQGSNWRTMNGATAMTTTVQATRLPAFVTPQ